MMTLPQWQHTRRVDHVSVPSVSLSQGFRLAHPRVRSSPGGLDLKMFDADVAAFARATNNVDRVGILGRIIECSSAFLALPLAAAPQRYRQAVHALYQSAQLEMNQICGGAVYQPLRTQDLVMATHQTVLPPKTVHLNIFYLAPIGTIPLVGPIDRTINTHIAQANTCPGFQVAGLTWQRNNPAAQVVTQSPTGQPILNPANGQFSDGSTGGERLIAYCERFVPPSATSIDIVCVEHYDQADVQGRTLRSGHDYNGSIPRRPIVTITMNPPGRGALTYPTTLAHELGHALTGEPAHSADPNNLMAEGANRNGRNHLTPGQIGWFRQNAHT